MLSLGPRHRNQEDAGRPTAEQRLNRQAMRRLAADAKLHFSSPPERQPAVQTAPVGSERQQVAVCRVLAEQTVTEVDKFAIDRTPVPGVLQLKGSRILPGEQGAERISQEFSHRRAKSRRL